LAEYRTGRHPHPAIRLLNVSHSVLTLADMVSAKVLKTARSACLRGFDRAEQLFATLGIGSAVWHAAEGGEDLKTEYRRVLDRAQEIGHDLNMDTKGIFALPEIQL
jgi:hypothetical protein